MSNEARVNSSLQVTVGKLTYSSQPSAFTADVSAAGGYGPTPGRVLATISGASVDLSKLTILGGFVRVQNMDSTNFIQVGMYDPDTGKTYWFMDLLPGETFIFRLSRSYANEVVGSGTTGSNVAYRVRVDPTATYGSTAYCLFEAFDR